MKSILPALIGILFAQWCPAQIQKYRYVIYLNADGRDCAESQEKDFLYVYDQEIPCQSSNSNSPNCCAFPSGSQIGNKSVVFSEFEFQPNTTSYHLMVKCKDKENYQIMFDFSSEAEKLEKPTIQLEQKSDSLHMYLYDFRNKSNVPAQEFSFSLQTVSEVCALQLNQVQSFFNAVNIIKVPNPGLKILNPVVQNDVLSFRWINLESLPDVESAHIFNSKGERVGELTTNSIDPALNVQTLNVSSYKSGTYFILVTAGVVQSSYKFVVQHSR